ncbi:fumarate hydratase, class II [Sarotherodon galilaeus]
MGVMSSPRFLPLHLLGALLLPLLLLPGSWAQHYDDFTSSPDYDFDYNSTFEYSFFSNTSSEDLDRLVERFLDPDETTEGTGGPEEEVTVTMVNTRRTTEGVNACSTAPFPVCLVRANISCVPVCLRLSVQETERWLLRIIW